MQRHDDRPSSRTGSQHRLAAGFCFSAFSLLACTPYGTELEDTLVGPEDDAAAEQDEVELEELVIPNADDDREQPSEDLSKDPRCRAGATLDAAWELPNYPVDHHAEPETGTMTITRGDKLLALPLQKTKFDTVVVGTVAETEVVQVFANPYDEVIEAVYLFPLHERAAVDDYSLQIGDRTIRGQIKTREDARKTYEDAKQDGRTAGLLEQQRPNIFTQHVANIPPGGVIEVSMHVVQPLEQDHGRYALVLPTVVGPRFIPDAAPAHPIPGPDPVPDAAKITAPIMPEGFTSCADVEVSVAIESGLRPQQLRSRHHQIDISREGDVAFVELDRAAGPVVANRDFVLSWELSGQAPRAAIVAQPERGSGGGYFTLTVQPPDVVPDDKATPRELVFVVDNSGSMDGVPIDTAKQLMRHALAGLRSDDMFNVLRFSDSASGLSSTMIPATAGNINIGLDYIERMQGEGGTNMMNGIDFALNLPRERERMRMVLFLTDGYIGNESEIFKLIEGEIGDARLFSLGVGGAPNRYLLDGMARIGRGAVTYAGQEQSIDEVVERFYERIQTPVLTDIEIDWKGLQVAEVLPGRVPDLFAGQPLTVFGRYQGNPNGEIIVRGKIHGEPIELPVRFDIAKVADIEGVSSVWARNKVDELLGYPSTVNAYEVDETTRKAVTEVALQYRIMTNYTSFVAVDERRVVDPDGRMRTVEQPLLLPEGTTYEGFMGDAGAAYGIGGLGLIGRGGSGGYGSGYGTGSGAGFGGRGASVPQVRQAKAEVMGSIDKDLIRRIVRAHMNEVRACYSQALAKDPNVSGRVTIGMEIGGDGKVVSTTVDSNDTGDEALGTCIAKVAKRWLFPKIPGGGTVTVHYPFVLSPG